MHPYVTIDVCDVLGMIEPEVFHSVRFERQLFGEYLLHVEVSWGASRVGILCQRARFYSICKYGSRIEARRCSAGLLSYDPA